MGQDQRSISQFEDCQGRQHRQHFEMVEDGELHQNSQHRQDNPQKTLAALAVLATFDMDQPLESIPEIDRHFKLTNILYPLRSFFRVEVYVKSVNSLILKRLMDSRVGLTGNDVHDCVKSILENSHDHTKRESMEQLSEDAEQFMNLLKSLCCGKSHG